MLQKNLNAGFTSLLDSVSVDASISSDTMLQLLIESTKQILAQESSLSLHLDFHPKESKMDIYAVRLVTEDDLGFSEINTEVAISLASKGAGFFSENSDHFYQFLRSVSFNADTRFFSREAVSRISGNLKRRLLDINKDKEYELFKDREGDLISGVVGRIEAGGHIILNLGLGEGFLSKYEIIPGEFFGIGTTVQAYVYQVERNSDKYQIKLSRNRPEFLACLMSAVIPEVENGLIEIKGIARDAGSRAKVAVYSHDANVDPVGSCIGRDGIRIKSVRSMIGNERIDIVRWDPDITVFINDALGVEVDKFILHEDNMVEIVCDDEIIEQIRKGRKQQIRLIARLTKRQLQLTSRSEDSLRTRLEKENAIEMFMRIGFTEDDAKLFFRSDIKAIEELLEADQETLESVLILTEKKMSLDELKQKAYVEYQLSIVNEYIRNGLDPQLVEVPHLFGIEPTFYKSQKISTKEELAHMDQDEILDMFGNYLADDPEIAKKQAEEIVIWSRGGTIG